MNGRRAIAFVIQAALCHHAAADIIHVSATMGEPGQQGGWAVESWQMLGSKFEVTRTMEVTAIGGHLYSTPNELLFGALVRLDGEDALPHGLPFEDEDIVAGVSFDAPWPSDDVRVPLAATLEPGWYGLVFGGGWFGSPPEDGGGMPYRDQQNMTGAYFFGYGYIRNRWQWHNDGFDRARFVVEGVPVVHIPAYDFEITRGIRIYGGLLSLRASDDEHMIIQAKRPPSVSQPSAQLIVVGQATEEPVRAVRFTLESSALLDLVIQWIDFYNFDTGAWERMDERSASENDATMTVRIDEDAQRFVNRDTGELRARVSFYDPGIPIAGWDCRIDWIEWQTVPVSE